MSILHTNSIITALDKALALECPEGFRLVRIIRKNIKNKVSDVITINPSMGTVVPALTDTQFNTALKNDVLRSYFQNMLEKAQDGTIRALVEAGETVVTHEALDVESIAAWVSTTAEGEGRMSADAIKQWFTVDIQDSLVVALAAKNGISETPTEAELEKLEKICSAFRDSMVKLAGRVPNSIPKKVSVQLAKAIECAPDSTWKTRMRKQLDKLTAQNDVDMFGGL